MYTGYVVKHVSIMETFTINILHANTVMSVDVYLVISSLFLKSLCPSSSPSLYILCFCDIKMVFWVRRAPCPNYPRYCPSCRRVSRPSSSARAGWAFLCPTSPLVPNLPRVLSLFLLVWFVPSVQLINRNRVSFLLNTRQSASLFYSLAFLLLALPFC